MPSYTAEQRADAVAEYLFGIKIKDIRAKCGVGKTTLWRWTQDLQHDHTVAARLRRLQQQKVADDAWRPPGLVIPP